MRRAIGVLYPGGFNRPAITKLLRTAGLAFHPLVRCRPYVCPWSGRSLANRPSTRFEENLPLHAGDCVKCGHCESRRPFHVKQEKRMEEIAKYFGK